VKTARSIVWQMVVGAMVVAAMPSYTVYQRKWTLEWILSVQSALNDDEDHGEMRLSPYLFCLNGTAPILVCVRAENVSNLLAHLPRYIAL
jgi:uncharacterized membrane protein